MTSLQIKQVASEIASLVPEMAHDSATNNAVLIEGIITQTIQEGLTPVRDPSPGEKLAAFLAEEKTFNSGR